MNFVNRLSLRAKVVIMVNGIVLMFGVMVLVLFGFFKKNYVRQTYDNFYNYSEVIGSYVQDQFFERYGDVQAFALNADLKNMHRENLHKVFDEDRKSTRLNSSH